MGRLASRTPHQHRTQSSSRNSQLHYSRDLKVTTNFPSYNFSEVTLVTSKSQQQPPMLLYS